MSRAVRPATAEAIPNPGPPDGQLTDRTARPATSDATPRAHPPGEQFVISWAHLRVVAEEYDALQQYRIAAGNRAIHVGETVHELTDIAARTQLIEKDLGKVLTNTYRQVVPTPIRTWQKAQAGIGDLQLARLLGHLGHPRIAEPHHWEGNGEDRILIADEPYERTVGQLWAYCGRTGERRKTKGMSAEEAMGLGKPILKMLSHLITEAMVKAGVRTIDKPTTGVYIVDERIGITPWGKLYLEYRKLHAGYGWTPGHGHNAALHRIAKDMLRELWIVSA